MEMFCYQCEQTAKGSGCTRTGVCGKDPVTSALQDLLVHGVIGLSRYAHRLRKLSEVDDEVDTFVSEAIFTTLTNVNFNPESIRGYILKAYELTKRLEELYESKGGSPEALMPESCVPAETLEGLIEQGRKTSVASRIEKLGREVTGLQELILYGLKGVCAYTYHAQLLGINDSEHNGRILEMLDFLANEPTDMNELLSNALKVGEVNLKAMELLDSANTSAYGHPEPTPVRITPVKGKAVLISGHDLKDLEELLKQTEGKGINVYTHGEMLPAHAYPKLKAYRHLVGNYGGAWQLQLAEFEAFPGPIVMTTNCLMPPRDSYKKRVFTCGPVSFPGCPHITDRDFSTVVECALGEEGFTEDAEERTITVGFARKAVLSVVDKVIEAVKAGKIRHFFLIGGCDGAKPGRDYYSRLAEAVPKDCVILTLACGKYRFNELDFGTIEGIPRLLDIGQCNDAYSAVQIAVALADAFQTDVNSLPLSLVLSWYEQKAVGILLTLLHLGIKEIRLGPSLPAFVAPSVLNLLVEKFDIKPISTPEEDLKAILS